jgi:hypothetical protein
VAICSLAYDANLSAPEEGTMPRLLALAALRAAAVSAVVLASSPAPAALERSEKVPIPALTLRQIKAEYGQFTYMPTFAPARLHLHVMAH